jgi:DNA processing protein
MYTTSSADLRGHVRLACVPGIGSRLRRLLLERFGSAEAIFQADPAELQGVARLGPKLAQEIPSYATSTAADEVLALCAARGVDIILEGDPRYPGLLSRIDDPPGLLFVCGEMRPADSLAVAIVGARHATAYGLRVAEQLAGGLARAGYTVVGGVGRGIDAAAHRGALKADGRTLAVLGSGVLSIYPPEHESLAGEVSANGALMSELPPLCAPNQATFPQRNRIVSGLSMGTIVVQASARSGALITARLAGEQGREVFAVPGPIDCRVSHGCHALIRDGAKLVESVDDVLEELGPLFETCTAADGKPVQQAAELLLNDSEKRVLAAVDAHGTAEPIAIDDLVDDTNLAAAQVLATIGVLEMRRLLRRHPGSRVSRR